MFPEAFFKEYLLQVLPETTLFAHRHTANAANEPWRLTVLACCMNKVVIGFTCKLEKNKCALGTGA